MSRQKEAPTKVIRVPEVVVDLVNYIKQLHNSKTSEDRDKYREFIKLMRDQKEL